MWFPCSLSLRLPRYSSFSNFQVVMTKESPQHLIGDISVSTRHISL